MEVEGKGMDLVSLTLCDFTMIIGLDSVCGS